MACVYLTLLMQSTLILCPEYLHLSIVLTTVCHDAARLSKSPSKRRKQGCGVVQQLLIHRPECIAVQIYDLLKHSAAPLLCSKLNLLAVTLSWVVPMVYSGNSGGHCKLTLVTVQKQ